MRRSWMRLASSILALTLVLFVTSMAFAQTGTWQTVDPENLPTARHETSFVQVGGKFYLIGGRESKVVQIYDPVTNRWTDGATAPKLMHHIQPVVVDNLIYAVSAYSGSCCDGEFGLSNNYIYDPLLNKWITGGLIPENRRRGGGGIVYYNGKFYIVGGLTGGHGLGNDNVSADSHNWFDSWDPYTGIWQVLPNMPRDRDHFGAAVVGDKLYAASGRASEGADFFSRTIAEVDVYSFVTGKWSTLPASADIPTERAGTAVVVLGGEILVMGGESSDQGSAHNETEALNPTNNTWRTLDTLNQGRHGTTAALCNGMVYVAAGSPTRGGGTLNSMERYYESVASTCPASTITPGQLAASGNSSFGQVQIGQSLTRTITITHSSGNQALIITGFSKTGSGDFSTSFPYTLPVTLAPGMRIDLSVTYTPSGTGTDTGTLAVTRHNSSQPLQIALSGEGVTASSATTTPTGTDIPTPTKTVTAAATTTATPTPTNTTTSLPTATITVTATKTPEASATLTETTPVSSDTPTLTATTGAATETPQATAALTETTPPVVTETPTLLPGGVELIVNGDFEAKNGEQQPELTPWVLKNGLKDKIKCRQTGKPSVAYTGECAFRFKGNIGERAALQQKVNLSNFDFTGSSRLTLSLHLKTGTGIIDGKVKVVVAYSDPEQGKSKIRLPLSTTTEYAEIGGSLLLLSSDVAGLKLQIKHRSPAGKILIDAISLQLISDGLLSLSNPGS